MFTSLLLASLPFAFMGSAQGYWVIVALAIVMGIGGEMWHPASFATLSTRYPFQRGLTFGLHGMAADLGDLLAPAVIGALLLTMTWREVVQLNFVPGLLVGAIILVLLRKLRAPSNGQKEPALASDRSAAL